MNEGMPQLEIPQISLARYFDLLKRRKWQVIPVSLLGLLIGGIVAFFVPRYYVAETVFQYHPPPGEVVRRSPREDPFRSIVDNAIHTMPLQITATLRQLGWEEATIADEAMRQAAEREIRDQLQVVDVNPGPERTYAQIRVRYRDRDGGRSANFLNVLVDTWKQNRIEWLRENADSAMRSANERLRLAIGEWEGVNRKMQLLADRHQLPLDLGSTGMAEFGRSEAASLERQQQALVEVVQQDASLQAEINRYQQELDATPRKKELDPAALATQLAGTPLQAAYLQLLAMKESLKGMGQAHPERPGTVRRVEQLEQVLAEFLDSQGEGTNPKIAELRAVIGSKLDQLAGVRARRAALAADIEKRGGELLARNEAFAQIQELQKELGEADEKRKLANQDLDAQIRVQTKLDQKEPIEVIRPAVIPEAPTEPNILMVAVLGCIIGLGAAIGLILVLDMLQGTIKTLDDAERALPVPVLGGVSYIETEEQRAEAVSGRRRKAMTAAALLFCGVVVVTVYYVAPERLPPFARDLLTQVLGD